MISTAFPNPLTISPAPLQYPIVQNVPDDNYLSYKYNWAIAPTKHTFFPKALLPRSPKNNIDNDPACLPCRYNTNQVENFSTQIPTCAMIPSKQQNIWGNICANGGSNADWVRGNDFADDYNYESINKVKYMVDMPRLKKRNDVLVSGSPFYPFPSYENRFNPMYKSFPYVNNFIDGHPTVAYPHQLTDGPNTSVLVENFSSQINANPNKYLLLLLLLIIVIIVIGICLRKK